MSNAIDAAIKWCQEGHDSDCEPDNGECTCGRTHVDAVLSEYDKLRAKLHNIREHCIAVKASDRAALHNATDSAMVLCAGTRKRAMEHVIMLIGWGEK